MSDDIQNTLMAEAAALGVGVFDAEEVKDRDANVYEIGFHLLPTLSETQAVAVVKDITNVLLKHGAVFVGEKPPVKMDLAYTIDKRIAGKITGFDTAHFGWLAFELKPASLVLMNAFLDTHESILRYILLTTTKEEVAAVIEGVVIMPTAVASTSAIAAPKRVVEEDVAVSDVALSKALDVMAAEDAGKEKDA